MSLQRVSTDRILTKRTFHQHRGGHSLSSLLLAIVLLLTAFGGVAVATQSTEMTPEQSTSLQQSVDWLMSQEANDGGFAGFSGESDPAVTSDAVIALASAANRGITVDLAPAIDYLRSQALVYTQFGSGSAAKLVLALVAAGQDPSDFEKVSPLAIVEAAATHGQIGNGPYDTALGLLALAGAGSSVPGEAIDYAWQTQLDDGSWSFDGLRDPGSGDTNTTALMIQALIAAGQVDNPAIQTATRYLISNQAQDGGFPYQPGAAGDVNSTSLVLQALFALESGLVDPVTISSASGFLLSMQSDSGAFTWMVDVPEDNLFATLQAIPAVAGAPLPILPLSPDAIHEATPVS